MVISEDLYVLFRVTRDVGLGLRGWYVGVAGWGSWATEETGEGVILEAPWGLTLGFFGWKGSNSEDKEVSETCCLPFFLALGMGGSKEGGEGERRDWGTGCFWL